MSKSKEQSSLENFKNKNKKKANKKNLITRSTISYAFLSCAIINHENMKLFPNRPAQSFHENILFHLQVYTMPQLQRYITFHM